MEAPDGLSGSSCRAGDKYQWPGLDDDRPLSVPGHREAHGLLARLRDYPTTRILTSPALRCVQTVKPLSLRRAVPIEVVDALRVDSPVEGLLELVTDPGLEGTVVCGHGEQIGALVRQLADGGLLIDAPLVWAKGSTWVLDTSQGRVVGGRYLAPLRLKDLAGHY
ncbi:MAG TPA: phosphoglycerate mutase family protein [Actinomycetes bacterium]|nr:phosphoglycerate mutase family protein [Actinomycetes bacterium]